MGNLYRNGHDFVGWHSDDEPSLGPHPTIASISLGDTRIFEMRKKPPKGDVRKSIYTYILYTIRMSFCDFQKHHDFVKIPLACGSLLIMEDCTQYDWQHRIPREYHDREARINLTFRVIMPF